MKRNTFTCLLKQKLLRNPEEKMLKKQHLEEKDEEKIFPSQTLVKTPLKFPIHFEKQLMYLSLTLEKTSKTPASVCLAFENSIKLFLTFDKNTVCVYVLGIESCSFIIHLRRNAVIPFHVSLVLNRNSFLTLKFPYCII